MHHVHFDVEKAMEKIRSVTKAANDEAMRRAKSDGGRELVRLQMGLDDFFEAFFRWDLERVNDGADDEISANALGYIIGNLIVSFASNCEEDPTEIVNFVFECINESVSSGFAGGHKDAVRVCVTVQSEEGGHA